MLYGKKRKQVLQPENTSRQPYVGVIETTMMYHSNEEHGKENVVSVSLHNELFIFMKHSP